MMATIAFNGDYMYYDDGSGYPYDEYEYDEYEYDHDDEEEVCEEENCTDNCVDYCQCCGRPLCVMHSEIGCGFCRNCPTEEWVNQMSDGNTTDPAPETPILPEDAPDGVPEIILIELPILPPIIVVVPEKDDDE